MQNSNYTDPNLKNLALNNTVLECPRGNQNCGLTTQNDVPGKKMTICLNPAVTLYNYKVRRTYQAGNTKWPVYYSKEYPFNQTYGY